MVDPVIAALSGEMGKTWASRVWEVGERLILRSEKLGSLVGSGVRGKLLWLAYCGAG
jgi:hypothetical protein